LRDQGKNRAEIVMDLPNGDCLHVPQDVPRSPARQASDAVFGRVASQVAQ
jgi:hypothetical protein